MPSKRNIFKANDQWLQNHRRSAIWLKPIELYVRLSALPAVVKEEDYWFYNISNLAYILISILHIMWIVMFSIYGFTPMAAFQAISIGAYIVALVLNRRGHHLLAMFIALLEVNVHQLTAAYYLGWGADFQYFIPLVGLLPFLKYNERWTTKTLLALMSLGFYLFIDIILKKYAPALPVTSTQTSVLSLTNAVVCFILVTLWGIVLAYSYNRTVHALLRKEQELFELKKAAEQADILTALEIKERDVEIFQLRNVELRNSNNEIRKQKKQIESLVSEQELVIAQRTRELAEANKKLIDLIQYNAHSVREPLTRIMGAMMVADYITREEFFNEIWDDMGKAVGDLDKNILQVIAIANRALENYEKDGGMILNTPDIPSIT